MVSLHLQPKSTSPSLTPPTIMLRLQAPSSLCHLCSPLYSPLSSLRGQGAIEAAEVAFTKFCSSAHAFRCEAVRALVPAWLTKVCWRLAELQAVPQIAPPNSSATLQVLDVVTAGSSVSSVTRQRYVPVLYLCTSLLYRQTVPSSLLAPYTVRAFLNVLKPWQPQSRDTGRYVQCHMRRSSPIPACN